MRMPILFFAAALRLGPGASRYWVDLLREYAALQRFAPKKDPDFVEIVP